MAISAAEQRKLFGQILVENGIVTQLQLDEALFKQFNGTFHHKIGEILVRLGYISNDHITDALAEQVDGGPFPLPQPRPWSRGSDHGGVIPDGPFDERFHRIFERLEKLEQQVADQVTNKEAIEELKKKIKDLEERLENAEYRLKYL